MKRFLRIITEMPLQYQVCAQPLSNSNFGLNTKMRVRYGLTLDRNRCYQWPL